MTVIAQELSQVVGITRACQALDIPRSRLYPRHAPSASCTSQPPNMRCRLRNGPKSGRR